MIVFIVDDRHHTVAGNLPGTVDLQLDFFGSVCAVTMYQEKVGGLYYIFSRHSKTQETRACQIPVTMLLLTFHKIDQLTDSLCPKDFMVIRFVPRFICYFD